MSMTVKAYLKRGENANAEIRRFVIDVAVSSNYEYLSKKVAQVFPSLGDPDYFSLSWKDSEGDNITFSSDDELVEALGQINDDTFRIYVKEKKRCRRENRDAPSPGTSTDDGAGQEEQAYHPGVICDGCESRIRGPRFKCITCPDYDLCKQCESRGIHPEHSFVKFRKPQVGRSHHGGFFNRPGMFRPFGHPGWRHWWRHQQQQQQGGDASTTQNEQTQGTQGPQINVGCTMGPGLFGGPPPPPHGPHMPPPPPHGPNMPPPPHEFLRDIGQTVAQMLDPLGIDVDIDIDNQGNRTHCAGEPNFCGGGGNGHGRGKHGRRHGGKGHRGCRKTWAGCEQGSSMDVGQEAEPAPSGAARSQEKSGEAGGNTQNKEQDATQKQPEGTAEPMETTVKDGSAAAPNQSPSGSDDADWTLLENAGGKPSAPSQNPQEDPSYQYQTALNQMGAMGFDNEGGWLTSLLDAKGGDIVRVLDAIKIGNQPSFSGNSK
ncbi:sequestosome-1 isoform X1 [Strongylocentrotus purpuratus]|uniref:Protein ref(2)P n=1 Tax=Strongylocentrotus purpuratus TaxID=7668 RepID=A0A7M7GG35_STRPU|nr:sequestosome-1 isoform X1 [Strongylocentrotus purpuratus]XP_030836948.1 sequestosome-1 isoform X1 [Strongylocentrotus purpuratus]